MEKFIKLLSYNLTTFVLILFFLSHYNNTHPIYLYTVVYPFQYILASLEASDLKPRWEILSENKGNCRIQNTIAVIKNPNLYIVFGTISDPKTGITGDHQWATSNPNKPHLYENIIDNTTGLTTENKKRAKYSPNLVYKLNTETCKLTMIKKYKNIPENKKLLVKSGKFYVEIFCKKYKKKYNYN